jgi:hypothetical protein
MVVVSVATVGVREGVVVEEEEATLATGVVVGVLEGLDGIVGDAGVVVVAGVVVAGAVVGVLVAVADVVVAVSEGAGEAVIVGMAVAVDSGATVEVALGAGSGLGTGVTVGTTAASALGGKTMEVSDCIRALSSVVKKEARRWRRLGDPAAESDVTLTGSSWKTALASYVVPLTDCDVAFCQTFPPLVVWKRTSDAVRPETNVAPNGARTVMAPATVAVVSSA